MKKLRKILLGAVAMFGVMASFTFTSCTKDQDVSLEDANIPNINMYSADAKDGQYVNCELCTQCGFPAHLVAPGDHCTKLFMPGECGVEHCGRINKIHRHTFWNLSHGEDYHVEISTHCGGHFHDGAMFL